ncbi:MAG: VOC family protein [Pseudomonadota bacterium]|nr:VOC family protein [Pseudomonadota bacterium]
MALNIDDQTVPPVAMGHIRMDVNALAPATDWMAGIGLRVVARHDTLSVLELRGGTHLVLRLTDDTIAPDTIAPIDLMVDNINAKHAECLAGGLEPSDITSGSVHSSFYVPGPSGYQVKITSSHTDDRAV